MKKALIISNIFFILLSSFFYYRIQDQTMLTQMSLDNEEYWVKCYYKIKREKEDLQFKRV